MKILLYRLSLFIYRTLYSIYSHFSTKNRVVFISYRPLIKFDNYYYLKKYFNDTSDLNVVTLNTELKPGFINLIKFILFIDKSIFYMATSKYVIVDDYFLPMYTVKKKDNIFIMIWHATGAYKKFGLSIKNSTYGLKKDYSKYVKIHSNYDDVYISSEKVKHHYAEAFGIDKSIIYGLGIPRIDLLYKESDQELEKQEIYRKYPILKNKKVILFAPTFRGKGQKSAKYNISNEDIYALNTLCLDDEIIIFKKHPFVKENYNLGDKVININDFHINSLLLVSDILITDFSSVIFEFALLNKPIFLYAKDLEDYKVNRDFYFDINKYKNIMYDNLHNVLNYINYQLESYDYSVLEDMRINNFDHFDRFNSMRIFENITRKR